MGAVLSTEAIEAFLRDGFVRLDDAFPRELADECRAILWRDLGRDPDDPSTWTEPVVRLGGYADPPFRAAASTERLRGALDQLIGEGRWAPLLGLGTFPVRFPHPRPPGDDGWHVDASYALEEDDPNDFLGWRVNVHSRGRALLALFLFSDIGEDDAPTRIRKGSHRSLARVLAPFGERGASLRELVERGAFDGSDEGDEIALATGPAGTVYLCHPFLVHAAQAHRGTKPRFLAQPPVFPREPLSLERPAAELSPVERAIVEALAESAG